MLRRFVSAVTAKLKSLKMAEATISPLVKALPADLSNSVHESEEKRSLDEKEAEQGPDAKKQKLEVAPMQGRPDRKRKCALLLSYCGAGYYGIQIQNNKDAQFKTIESVLIKALLAAGLIPEDHAENPSKMSFQRAARTDKNVSASGNIVSLKMLYDEAVPEKINMYLPPEIRVIGCLRTTRGFDSKHHCTARTYKYMLPTYSFAPVEKFITRDYRISEDILQKVNEMLGKYIGTHNFHNFTSGKKPNDPSSKRYIISFECGNPFTVDGVEFTILTVKGQSFMMHHIRKMIGLMISIVRGYCGEDALIKSWGPMKVDVPKAPGLGLFLDELFFQGYNKKFGKDGMHEPLVWDKYREALDKFKEDHILSHIAQAEVKEGVMLRWLGTLQFHKFDVIDPNLPVPPDGEHEKDLNWYKTKYLLQKLDKTKKEVASVEGSQDPASSCSVPDSTTAEGVSEVAKETGVEQPVSSTTVTAENSEAVDSSSEVGLSIVQAENTEKEEKRVVS